MSAAKKRTVLEQGTIRVREAAIQLSVSEDLIYKMMNAGLIESIRFQGCRLILKDEFSKILEQRRKGG